MSDTYLLAALAVAWALGTMCGMAVAMAFLWDHPWFWTTLLRIPGALFKKLDAASRANGWSM